MTPIPYKWHEYFYLLNPDQLTILQTILFKIPLYNNRIFKVEILCILHHRLDSSHDREAFDRFAGTSIFGKYNEPTDVSQKGLFRSHRRQHTYRCVVEVKGETTSHVGHWDRLYEELKWGCDSWAVRSSSSSCLYKFITKINLFDQTRGSTPKFSQLKLALEMIQQNLEVWSLNLGLSFLFNSPVMITAAEDLKRAFKKPTHM